MLPETARSVIGVPHPSGRAAMRMLENEGFAFENYIDIFDGGPTMPARTDQVTSIAGAQHIAVARTRSEEHTSELPSLMRRSYAVFCLKKKQNKQTEKKHTQ